MSEPPQRDGDVTAAVSAAEFAAAPEGDAGNQMHIHRPKPPHGLRELLIEIGVIVVGIAIALTGEQAVEWLHWRAVVAETRHALDGELESDLGAVQARIDEGPCIARRLRELSTVFHRHAQGQSLGLKGPLGQPQFPHTSSSVWQTALSDQGAAHMPLDERLRYARLYGALDWLRGKTEEESNAWSYLSLIDDNVVLTEQDWSSLHQWAAHARSVAEKVNANTSPFSLDGVRVVPLFDLAAALGVKTKTFHFFPASKSARDALCRPML